MAKVLRQKAEELLKKKQSKPGLQLSEGEKLRLMHELEVHQIELEMINDELVLTNERAAELATNKYVELYDFAPSGYFTLSKDGLIIGANLLGAQLLGKVRSELKNQRFKVYVSDDTIGIFDQFLDKIFTSKVRQTCDVVISTIGNLPTYVQLAGILDVNGNQCLVTAVDISELKLAERNLLIANQELAFQNEEKAKRADELQIANIELAFQTEEKAKRAAEMIVARKEISYQEELLVANSYLENLIDNANAPIIIWDPQFRIKRFNHAFEVLTGLTEVEAIGQPLEILFPTKLAANSMAHIRKTQHGEKLETIEIEIQHRKGSVRVVLWNSATIFEPDGQTPIATLAQGQDITDRIRFEHQLEERLKELQTLYNLTRITNREDAVVESLAQEMVVLIPKGWQYPEIACCRIVIDGVGFSSENFQDTPWKQSAPISVSGETIGLIEVAYLREMPNEAEGPFLHEERLLINALAEHLQQSILRIRNQIGLQESKLRLEKAMQVAKMAWMEVDLVRGNVVFEKGRAEILGYDVKKIISFKDYLKFVYPDDLDNVKETMGNHLKGHSEKYEIEYRRWTHTEGYKWFCDIGSVVERGQNGAPIKFASLTMDITDRKVAEQERARQSQLITMLLDSIPDLIFYKDTEGVYLGCNPPFATFVGKKRNEIVGKTDYDLFDKEIADFFRQKDVEMLEQKLPRHNEEWVTYSDGRKVLLDTLKTPYWSGDGNLIGILGISRDITSKSEAEKKLKESETKYQLLFENMVEGFSLQEIITDNTGQVVDFRILAANAAYGKHTGQKPSDVIGKTLRSTMPQVDPLQIERYAKVALTGEPLTFEYYSHTFNRHLRVRAFCPQLGQFATTFEDITASKQAENRLRESEERFEKLSDHSRVITWEVDANGLYTYMSNTCLTVLGYRPGELIGKKHFYDLHPEDSREAFMAGALEIFERKEFIRNLENQVQSKDGNIFWVSTNGMPILDEHGRLCGYGGTDTDISERKQAEEKHRQSEKRYRLLVETAQEGILVAQKGFLKLVNPILTEMTGYSEEELYSIPFLEFVHPYDRDLVKDNYLKRISGIKVESRYHLRLVRKDTSLLWVELSGNIIDWEGQPATLNFINDITGRKQAEDQIMKLAKGVEQSPATIVITDINGVIEFVNPKFCQLSGYTIQEAIGNNPRMLKSGHTTQEYYQDLWKTILSGKEWHGEFHNKKKNGEFYWEMASISPIINAKGEITNFIAVKEDITKEKQTAEALLKAKHEAEAASKSKSSFLANMSHEIRTPLNAIIGFSQLMDRDKLLTGQSKEYANSINRAGEHLLSLINDILELSKAEAGRVVLNPSNFDLNTLLNDLDIIFKERIQSKQLRLTFEIAPDLPRSVFADEGKLRQVFINLIGNALKFTDQGGIVVRARIEKRVDGTNCLFADVEDSGHGIAEDEIGKIFSAFEQTSSGIKQGSGTGLGLALSRELAILMGGNITVISEVGKGSVFTFQVGIKEGTDNGTTLKTVKRVVGMAKRQKAFQVLVVDDLAVNLIVAVNFLKLAGFETIEATNGKEAIEKFEEYFPDLVLIDLRMPVMNGYEAIRHIRSTEKGKLVPIVAISANLFEDEKIKLQDIDIQGYIHKPFREGELFGIIGKVLGIEYTYEEEIPAPSPEYIYDDDAAAGDMTKLPANLLLKLREAIEIADSDMMGEILNSNNLDNQELTKHLLKAANNFEWDYLLRVSNL